MNRLVVFSITLYQAFVSPIIKQTLGIKKICKYSPTCSQYAVAVFATEPFLLATKKSIARVYSCK